MVVVFLVTALLAALSLVAFSPTAHAASGRCSDDTGLNLVVDKSAFGGSIDVFCLENWQGGTAWQAFSKVVSLTGTAEDPTRFVCRVDGLPTPSEEACIETPPRSALWG